MTDRPLVSVVIPMLNEADDIAGCLAAVLDQDHPHDRLEVLVVDGGSSDASVAIAEGVLSATHLAGWQILTNDAGITPASLNLGLAAAAGAVLCRVDARTIVQPDHVSRCVEVLTTRPDVAVVGGSQVAEARGRDARSQGIARTLNNRLSMGGASYRSGGTSGPADTVYLGAFRTDELRASGGWDERFPTNQDFELNRRMGTIGQVWFDAGIRSGYLPRAELGALYRQYVRFGRWKVRYWRISGDAPLRRQRRLLALPVVPLLLALVVALRRPAALVPLAAIGAVVLAGIDEAGSSAQAPPRVRALSLI
ncbi:MAG: glycosyltransferase, partial [Acidimicrobiales bacterium]